MTSQLTGMRAFIVIWFGQFVSLVGSSMTRFAIGIWLFQETGLATTFMLMVFFTNLPRILLSPFAGAIVDRSNRKLMMMVSDFGTGLTTLIIFFLLQTDSLNIWHIYILAAFSSAFESFQFPAYSSSITLMVDKKQYARTSAMLSLADDGSFLIAPVLAAILLVSIGLEGIVIIDVITFGIALATLMSIHIPQPGQSDTGKQAGKGILREAAYGFKFMLDNPSLLGLQVNFLFVNLMMGMSILLRTPLVLARTGGDEIVLGIVSSWMAAGGIVGGLVMTIWGGPKRRIHGVLGGIILLTFSRAIFGLGQELVVWSIGTFLIMFFVTISNSSNQAIWQSKTPVDVQGRVFAARRITGQITFPIAVLLGGVLSDQIFEPAMAEGGSLSTVFDGLVGAGPGAGMSLLVLLTVVVGLIVPVASYFIPTVRNLEDIVPDIEIITTDEPSSTDTVDATPELEQQPSTA